MNNLPDIPYDSVVCRYGELALKKGNRARFEQILMEGIHRALAGVDGIKCRRERGRVFLELAAGGSFSAEQMAGIREGIPKVFGLTSASIGISTEVSLEALEETIFGYFPKMLEQFSGDTVTYRMRCRRSNKDFPMRAKEVEIHFADRLLEQYPQLKVDLSNAELTIYLEIREKRAFLSFDEIPAPGGLPTGTAAPALVLLSGGIDSPVAAHLMQSRGCRLDYLTFHSYPYTTMELLDKVAGIAKVLNEWQTPGKLFACNLAEAQKLIRDNCNERLRTVLYRRLMFRVAAELAGRRKRPALVTGESVGQVASQTVPNLDVINRATDMLVLRPLLGIDKVQTTDIARHIGTLELSNVQCPDSCTVFQPPRPATNAKLHIVEEEEAKLDQQELLELCLHTIEELPLS